MGQPMMGSNMMGQSQMMGQPMGQPMMGSNMMGQSSMQPMMGSNMMGSNMSSTQSMMGSNMMGSSMSNTQSMLGSNMMGSNMSNTQTMLGSNMMGSNMSNTQSMMGSNMMGSNMMGQSYGMTSMQPTASQSMIGMISSGISSAIDNADSYYINKELKAAAHQCWDYQDGFIINKANPNFCLDVYGGNPAPGTHIICYPRNFSQRQANQQWEIINGHVISKLNGLVLDIEGARSEAGTRIIMWHRKGHHDNPRNQLWNWDYGGHIVSRLPPHLVIDIQGGQFLQEGCNVVVHHKKKI